MPPEVLPSWPPASPLLLVIPSQRCGLTHLRIQYILPIDLGGDFARGLHELVSLQHELLQLHVIHPLECNEDGHIRGNPAVMHGLTSLVHLREYCAPGVPIALPEPMRLLHQFVQAFVFGFRPHKAVVRVQCALSEFLRNADEVCLDTRQCCGKHSAHFDENPTNENRMRVGFSVNFISSPQTFPKLMRPPRSSARGRVSPRPPHARAVQRRTRSRQSACASPPGPERAHVHACVHAYARLRWQRRGVNGVDPWGCPGAAHGEGRPENRPEMGTQASEFARRLTGWDPQGHRPPEKRRWVYHLSSKFEP